MDDAKSNPFAWRPMPLLLPSRSTCLSLRKLLTVVAGFESLDAEAQRLLNDSAAAAEERQVLLFPGFFPHDELFQRASIVICHGGAGTVHAAIRNECPVIVSPILPSESDQVGRDVRGMAKHRCPRRPRGLKN